MFVSTMACVRPECDLSLFLLLFLLFLFLLLVVLVQLCHACVCASCGFLGAASLGRCVACPADRGAAVGALLGIALALAVSAFFVFKIRHVLPVGVIKLGVSMFQVGAGALLLPFLAPLCFP